MGDGECLKAVALGLTAGKQVRRLLKGSEGNIRGLQAVTGDSRDSFKEYGGY